MEAAISPIATARSPRKDLSEAFWGTVEAWRLVGIFARRASARQPRRAHERLALTVRGPDAIEGAPVLDVKPWVDEFAPIGATRQPDWAGELMRDYFKD